MVIVPGKVVTFTAVDRAGRGPAPRSRSVATVWRAQEDTSDYHAIVTLSGDVVSAGRIGQERRSTVDGDAAAVRVIDDTVWVADGEGRVRAYDLRGNEADGVAGRCRERRTQNDDEELT